MHLTNKQRAYRHIRDKLLRSDLAAGQRLSPAALAKEMGISQIPVREALSQLDSEGLVVHVPRCGAFVRTLDRDELIELIELRELLECYAAAQAARRISGADLDELEGHLLTLRRLVREFPASGPAHDDVLAIIGRWTLADLAFHMVILRAAGNRHVLKMIQDARILTQMFGRRNDPPAAHANLRAFYAGNYRIHRDVFRALERHDSKQARRAMSAHQRRDRKIRLARFDWLHQEPRSDDPLSKDFSESMRAIVQRIEQGESPLAEPEQTKKPAKGRAPRQP